MDMAAKTLQAQVLSRGQVPNSSYDRKIEGGVMLRPYQIEIATSDDPRLLVVQPTGAGKSLTIIAGAGRRLEQGLSTVIIIPKLIIGISFAQYVGERGLERYDAESGELTTTIPPNGIFSPDSDKTNAVTLALSGPPSIVVCSYEAFAGAWHDLSDEARQRLRVVVDEGHHAGFAVKEGDDGQPVLDTGKSTRLANCVDAVLEAGVDVHIYTATDFRTKRLPVVPPHRKESFETIRRTQAQHYREGYCPDFDIQLAFYEDVTASVYKQMDHESTEESPMLGDIDALISGYINA